MAVDPYGIEPMAGMTALGWGGPSRIQQIAAMHGRPPAQTQTVPMQYSFGPQGQIGRSPFPAQSNPYGSNIGSAIASYMNGQNRWGQPPPPYGFGGGIRPPASGWPQVPYHQPYPMNPYKNPYGGVWNGPPNPYTSPSGIPSQWNSYGGLV